MAQDSPRGPIRIVVTGEQPAIVPIDENSIREEKQEASIYFRSADLEYYKVASQSTSEQPAQGRDTSVAQGDKKHPSPGTYLAFFAAGAATSILTVIVLGCFWALGKGVPPEQLIPLLRGIQEPLITSLVGIISGAVGTYFLTRKGKKD